MTPDPFLGLFECKVLQCPPQKPDERCNSIATAGSHRGLSRGHGFERLRSRAHGVFTSTIEGRRKEGRLRGEDSEIFGGSLIVNIPYWFMKRIMFFSSGKFGEDLTCTKTTLGALLLRMQNRRQCFVSGLSSLYFLKPNLYKTTPLCHISGPCIKTAARRETFDKMPLQKIYTKSL